MAKNPTLNNSDPAIARQVARVAAEERLLPANVQSIGGGLRVAQATVATANNDVIITQSTNNSTGDVVTILATSNGITVNSVDQTIQTFETNPAYILPAATDAVLGGVIIGTGLSIDEAGILSVGEGASGYSGYSGYSGTSGFSGESGISGFSGESGISGFSGESGISGFSGAPGSATDNIANGTSNVSIATTNGNVTVSVGGTSNVAVFTTTGTVTSGNLTLAQNLAQEGSTPTAAGNTTISHVIPITINSVVYYIALMQQNT